eukprot:158997-Chlamydomonas_euryale.AAC.3
MFDTALAGWLAVHVFDTSPCTCLTRHLAHVWHGSVTTCTAAVRCRQDQVRGTDVLYVLDQVRGMFEVNMQDQVRGIRTWVARARPADGPGRRFNAPFCRRCASASCKAVSDRSAQSGSIAPPSAKSGVRAE